MKRKLIGSFAIFLSILFVLFGWDDYHFTKSSAMPNDKEIIQSIPTVYGYAVIFEDRKTATFGVAEIIRKLGFLYQFKGEAQGAYLKKYQPFAAVGLARGPVKKDSFLVGIKVAKNSQIKHIVIGNYLELFSQENDHLTLTKVRKESQLYKILKVENNYTFCVLDHYSKDSWTIRAFDQNGHIVADQLFGMGTPRYIGSIE